MARAGSMTKIGKKKKKAFQGVEEKAQMVTTKDISHGSKKVS